MSRIPRSQYEPQSRRVTIDDRARQDCTIRPFDVEAHRAIHSRLQGGLGLSPTQQQSDGQDTPADVPVPFCACQSSYAEIPRGAGGAGARSLSGRKTLRAEGER